MTLARAVFVPWLLTVLIGRLGGVLWLLTVLTVLTVSIVPIAGARASSPWVIAIGNNVGLPDEAPLRYAERDAVEVATVMQKHGGVPASNAVTILGQGELVMRAVLAVTAERIRTSSPDALVVVFYSGHADARGLHLAGDTLPFAEVERLVAALPAKLRVLVIDACRSGGVTRVKGVRSANEFAIESADSLATRGLAVITSSTAGEDSYESERLRASFFSHHFVTGLRGAADANGDQQVALDEAYRYTYDQTLKSSGQARALQHPTFRLDVRGRGEVVLTRLDDDPRSARLVLPEPGTYLILEGSPSGPIIAEANAARSGTEVLLAARRYFVQARYARHFLEYDIRLSAGAKVSLGATEGRRVDYARLVRKGGGERRAVHNLRLHGGARGETLAGLGVSGELTLGYGLDLSALSLGLRVRYMPEASLGEPSPDGLERHHSELGVGLDARRFFDLPGLSLGVGLLLEGAWQHQRFSRDIAGTVVESRDGFAFSFGLMASLQVPLVGGLQLELDGGPLAVIQRASTISQGAPRGDETRPAITWFASGGLAWTF